MIKFMLHSLGDKLQWDRLKRLTERVVLNQSNTSTYAPKI